MGVLVALLLAGVAAVPDDLPPPIWHGVWQGTIGTLPVRACLARQGGRYSIGSYYYLRRLRPIPLRQVEQSRVWTEGHGSDASSLPKWRFESVTPTLLTGSWSAGTRRLQFRLTRVFGLRAEEEPCGSLLFNRPRLRALQVTERRATTDGVRYTVLNADPGPAFEEVGLTTFALDGGNPATRRINQVLRRPIAGEPAASDWLECLTGGLNAHGSDGDFSVEIRPTMITGRWLAATVASGTYCGGAHPNFAATSLVFDRVTGAEVSLLGWLNPQGVERRPDLGPDVALVRPALRHAILAQAKGVEAECREAIGEAEFWDLGLARTGLSFTPDLPHVLTSCEEATVMPWASLAQFLNAAGRAGAASLR